MKQLEKLLDIEATLKNFSSPGQNKFENGNTVDKQSMAYDGNIAVLKHQGWLLNEVPAKTDHYCLVLCLNGSATRTINQFRFRVTPGSIHLALPQTLNAYHESTKDLELHMLFFKKEFMSDSMIREAMIQDFLDGAKGLLPHRVLPAEQLNKFIQLYEKLDGEVNTRKLFHSHMVRLVFIELLLETKRLCYDRHHDEIKNWSRSQQLTNDLRKLVDDHFLELKTVKEYADLLFVTPKHLSEVVKLETGLNPLHFIHTRIFQEAKYWLCASAMSMTQIADKLNFDTSSHFSRFFKQFTGYNPKEFQRIQCAI